MSRINATILVAAIVLTASMGLKTALSAHSSDTILMANGSAVTTAPWNGPAPPPSPWKDTLTSVQPRQNGPLHNGPAPPPAPWKDTLTGRSTTPKSW